MPKVHNLLRFSLLILLQKGPAHGYELIQKLKKTFHQPVSASHVYPFLHELEKKKWVASKESQNGEKNIYRLTPSGRKEVLALLSQFENLVEASLAQSLSECAHCNCKIFKGAYHREGKPFCCRFCADAFERRGP